MFFVVEKRRLQRMIALTRDDHRPNKQANRGTFFRIEARDGRLRLTGHEVTAEFPATIYEEGVLFLHITLFRRALQHLTNAPTVAIQVQRDGLHVGDVRLPLEPNEMLLYSDPQRAPAHHPDEHTPDSESDQSADSQGRLFFDL